MSHQHLLYDQVKICPICGSSFPVKRVRSSACRSLGRDTDFAVQYKDINPLIYGIWVCPQCFYAAPELVFETLTPKEKEVLTRELFEKKSEFDADVSFMGVRTYEVGIRSYELAIYCYRLRDGSASILAGLYLKAAWLCREMGDIEREYVFMEQALNAYMVAFDVEPFPIGKLTRAGLSYLIGELYRRLGKNRKAIQWFESTLKLKSIRLELNTEQLTRDQLKLAKQDLEENPEPEDVDNTETQVQQEQTPVFETKNITDIINRTKATAITEKVKEIAEQTLTEKSDSTVSSSNLTEQSQELSRAIEKPKKQLLLGLFAHQIEWLEKVVSLGRANPDRRIDKMTVLRSVLTALMETNIPENELIPKERFRKDIQELPRKQLLAALYPEQIEWLDVTASKIKYPDIPAIEKQAALRGIIDSMIELELPIPTFSSEDELIAEIKRLLA